MRKTESRRWFIRRNQDTAGVHTVEISHETQSEIVQLPDCFKPCDLAKWHHIFNVIYTAGGMDEVEWQERGNRLNRITETPTGEESAEWRAERAERAERDAARLTPDELAFKENHELGLRPELRFNSQHPAPPTEPSEDPEER